MCGVTEQEIRKAVILFQGVKRRFDIQDKSCRDLLMSMIMLIIPKR